MSSIPSFVRSFLNESAESGSDSYDDTRVVAFGGHHVMGGPGGPMGAPGGPLGGPLGGPGGHRSGDEVEEELPRRPTPGTRKFRRWMNDHLTDNEASVGEGSDDEHVEPMVQYQWKSIFTKVEDDFYTSTTRRVHEKPTRPKKPGLIRHSRHLRKQAQGAGHSLTDEESATEGDGLEETAINMFLRMHRRVRRSLRTCERAFLSELEALLVKFKNGQLNGEQAAEQSFDKFTALVPPKQEGKAWAVTPLALLFDDSYQRCIAHGVAQFHQLVSCSFTNERGYRVCLITFPKKGLPNPHAFTLIDFLATRATLLAQRAGGPLGQQAGPEQDTNGNARAAAKLREARARRRLARKVAKRNMKGANQTEERLAEAPPAATSVDKLHDEGFEEDDCEEE
eukprot:g40344.t1